MKERLTKLVEEAKFKFGKKQRGIAEMLGISEQSLSDMLKGRRKNETLELYTNKLEAMLDAIENTEDRTDSIPGAVPFFDDEIFSGGYLQGTGSAIMDANKVDDVKLPFLKVKDGDFAVQVHGRSMIDAERPELSINDGAIVCLRPWTENFIEYGERYAIATRSGFTVKYITPSEKEGYIKVVPANKTENFAPYYISVSDITGFAKVTAIINMQIL